MAKVDYFALTEAVETQIDNNVSNVKTMVEREITFGMDTARAVGIYLMSRNAPADMQRLAAGTRTDFLVTFTVRCFGFDIESIRAASERRDDLIGDVENALMTDREIQGQAIKSWLEGGDFFLAEESGFIAAGDIRLTCHVAATT